MISHERQMWNRYSIIVTLVGYTLDHLQHTYQFECQLKYTRHSYVYTDTMGLFTLDRRGLLNTSPEYSDNPNTLMFRFTSVIYPHVTHH